MLGKLKTPSNIRPCRHERHFRVHIRPNRTLHTPPTTEQQSVGKYLLTSVKRYWWRDCRKEKKNLITTNRIIICCSPYRRVSVAVAAAVPGTFNRFTPRRCSNRFRVKNVFGKRNALRIAHCSKCRIQRNVFVYNTACYQ